LTFSRLLAVSLCSGFLAVAGLLGLCTLGDPFYLFGRAPLRGADVSFYDNERLFKYWLAQHFVPGAYDKVILGPSYTASLDPAGEPGGEGVYNLSFRGANSGEMLILGEAAGAPGTAVKVAFLCLDPYVVKSLNPRTADMDPRTFRMAYLSWPVLSHFFQKSFFPLSPHAKFFSRQGANNEYAYLEGANSSLHIEEELRELRDRFAAPFRPKAGAVKNLARLVAGLRVRGIRTVGFIPPKPRAHRALKQADYDEYVRETVPLFGPLDRFLNLERTAGLGDENFVDAGGHLSERGSRWLLRRLLDEARDIPLK
jgi:hypothetical protein